MWVLRKDGTREEWPCCEFGELEILSISDYQSREECYAAMVNTEYQNFKRNEAQANGESIPPTRIDSNDFEK